MPIRPVDEQPCIDLRHWKIMETDERQCHLIGRNAATGMVRVSSAIVAMDAHCEWAITASGRRYKLAGGPGQWDDADYAWGLWAAVNAVRAFADVTDRFVKAQSSLQACSISDALDP